MALAPYLDVLHDLGILRGVDYRPHSRVFAEGFTDGYALSPFFEDLIELRRNALMKHEPGCVRANLARRPEAPELRMARERACDACKLTEATYA